MKFEKVVGIIEDGLGPDEELVVTLRSAIIPKLSPGQKRRSGALGALALTSTRVRFVGASLFDKSDVTIPLDTVTSVESGRSLEHGRLIRIAAAGAVHEFRPYDKHPETWVSALADAIAARRRSQADETA